MSTIEVQSAARSVEEKAGTHKSSKSQSLRLEKQTIRTLTGAELQARRKEAASIQKPRIPGFSKHGDAPRRRHRRTRCPLGGVVIVMPAEAFHLLDADYVSPASVE